MDRLEPFTKEEKERIEFAYQLMKAGHRGQLRDDGERYAQHPRNVVLIALDECKLYDSDIVIAGLLHDIAEDTAIFGNPTKLPYYEYIRLVESRITQIFGPSVAEIVVALTKPHIDNKDITDKKQAERLNFEKIRNASEKAIIVKMLDRLHNLRTLSGSPKEKQRRKIIETETEYFPIFKSEKVTSQYPEEFAYLLSQMKVAISRMSA